MLSNAEVIDFAMKNEDIQNYNYKIEENGTKNGFVSTIKFAKISGVNQKGVTHHIVLKCSDITGDQIFPKQIMSEAEVLMYTKILNEFEKLQKNTEMEFAALPKCYGSVIIGNRFLIILENLKSVGYELWPREKPVTMEHTELVFTEYAKLHALSFALKKLKPDLFKEIAKSVTNSWAKFAINSNYSKAISKIILHAKDLLRPELGDELDKFYHSEEDIRYILTEMYKEDEECSVITHMDSWNNNFMYKYEENKDQTKNPNDVKILDWQCIAIASPIFDLSYFFYSTSSKIQYENLQKLLEIYHTNLTKFIKQLGCDPEKIYPYSKFTQQWKKFSKFGAVLAPIFIKIIWLAPEEDLPDFDEVSIHDPDKENVFDITLNEERVLKYKNYLLDLFRHFLSHN